MHGQNHIKFGKAMVRSNISLLEIIVITILMKAIPISGQKSATGASHYETRAPASRLHIGSDNLSLLRSLARALPQILQFTRPEKTLESYFVIY